MERLALAAPFPGATSKASRNSTEGSSILNRVGGTVRQRSGIEGATVPLSRVALGWGTRSATVPLTRVALDWGTRSVTVPLTRVALDWGARRHTFVVQADAEAQFPH